MAQKQNPSFIPRFTGPNGKRNLLGAICNQQAVGHDRELALRLISAAGCIKQKSANREICRQGDPDNDVYFLIAGKVGVIVNGREIAVREGGTHVGEMALLDPTSKRSATLRTHENTLYLKVSEPDITAIAEDFPHLWRAFAVELGKRLRERSRFLKEPNPTPHIFIGSSSEALNEVKCIARSLKRRGFTCKVWTDGIFQLSQTTIESLIEAAKSCDFAILCLTPDDLVTSRGRRAASPRDNVVFELGLFMGALGRDRTYVVSPRTKTFKLPTDLLGLTRSEYQPGPKKTLAERLKRVSKEVALAVTNLGSK